MTTVTQNINDLQAFGRIGDNFFACFESEVIEKAYSLGRGKMHVGTVQGSMTAVDISKDEAKELHELAKLHNVIKKFLPTSKTSWIFWLA